jgi:dTDP-4-amino-4,6-dideoxygalactose transaminase
MTIWITTPTYIRVNGNTYSFLARNLLALQRNTDQDWRWVIIADGISSRDFEFLQRMFAAEPRVTLENLAKPGERDSTSDSDLLWCHGGATASTRANDLAIDLGAKWVFHLDDDDVPSKDYVERLHTTVAACDERDVFIAVTGYGRDLGILPLNSTESIVEQGVGACQMYHCWGTRVIARYDTESTSASDALMLELIKSIIVGSEGKYRGRVLEGDRYRPIVYHSKERMANDDLGPTAEFAMLFDPPIGKSRSLKLNWVPTKLFEVRTFMDYLVPSIEACHLTNQGPLQNVLGSQFLSMAHLISIDDDKMNYAAIPCANGTAALHALVSLWNSIKGCKLRWVTQAFTFAPAHQGPLSESLIVDNCAIHGGPDLTLIDLDAYDGILVTNCMGRVTDVEYYEEFARTHNKVLLFDNAATPLGTVGGRSIHSFGDGSIVSLHETKLLGRGEGGLMIVRENLRDQALSIINFGFDLKIDPKHRVPTVYGSNYRMSDISAAAILAWWRHVEATGMIDRIKALHVKFESNGEAPDFADAGSTLFACMIRRKTPELTDFCERMRVEAKQYYRPLKSEATPVATRWYEDYLCMPLYPSSTVDYVYNVLPTCV